MMRSLFNHRKFSFSKKTVDRAKGTLTIHGEGLNALVTQYDVKEVVFTLFAFQILLICL